jgi:hypothetical protein
LLLVGLGEKKMRFRYLAAALLAMAGMATASRADSVNAAFQSVTNGGIVLNVSAAWLGTVGGYVGQYNWVTHNNSDLGAAGTSFYTFCIELNQDINFGGQYTYQLIDPADAPKPGNPIPGPNGMGPAAALLLDELWGQHIGDVTNAPNSATEITNAAAFQVAVWNIVYNNTVTTNNTSINNLAAGWVSGLNANGPKADIIALSSDDHPTGANNGAQDQITAVPLPATAWAGAALLIGLGALKFRGGAMGRTVQFAMACR